jgi:hypothetical protein
MAFVMAQSSLSMRRSEKGARLLSLLSVVEYWRKYFLALYIDKKGL